MLSLKDARTVRDTVLAREDAERATGVINGVEHSCWQVAGRGWTARLTTVWDNRAALPRPRAAMDTDTVEDERFELFVDGVDGPVLEFRYRLDDATQEVVSYRCGRWERHFEVGPFRRFMSPDEGKERVLRMLAAPRAASARRSRGAKRGG